MYIIYIVYIYIYWPQLTPKQSRHQCRQALVYQVCHRQRRIGIRMHLHIIGLLTAFVSPYHWTLNCF